MPKEPDDQEIALLRGGVSPGMKANPLAFQPTSSKIYPECFGYARFPLERTARFSPIIMTLFTPFNLFSGQLHKKFPSPFLEKGAGGIKKEQIFLLPVEGGQP